MEIRKWNPAETMVPQPSSHKYHIRRLMRSQSLDSLWSVVRGSLTCAVSVDSLALPLLAVKGINKCVRASPSHGNGHLTASCRFVSPKPPLRCALRSPNCRAFINSLIFRHLKPVTPTRVCWARLKIEHICNLLVSFGRNHTCSLGWTWEDLCGGRKRLCPRVVQLTVRVQHYPFVSFKGC